MNDLRAHVHQIRPNHHVSLNLTQTNDRRITNYLRTNFDPSTILLAQQLRSIFELTSIKTKTPLKTNCELTRKNINPTTNNPRTHNDLTTNWSQTNHEHSTAQLRPRRNATRQQTDHELISKQPALNTNEPWHNCDSTTHSKWTIWLLKWILLRTNNELSRY